MVMACAALETGGAAGRRDPWIAKAESLRQLIGRDIGRWLDCWMKMKSPEYAAALAGQGFAEDWGGSATTSIC